MKNDGVIMASGLQGFRASGMILSIHLGDLR